MSAQGLRRVRILNYLDVASSWCHWAEPAWAELQRRYAGPDIDYDAAWSPDGKSIVFTSERNGSADLYRVNPMQW